MKFVVKFLILLTAIAAPFGAVLAARFMHEPCDILRYSPMGITPEQMNQTGCALSKAGWKEIARCDGHRWQYLMQKDTAVMMCEGIDALAGASEKYCVPYTGDVTTFDKQAQCEKNAQ